MMQLSTDIGGVVPVPTKKEFELYAGKVKKIVADETLPKNHAPATLLLQRKTARILFLEDFIRALALNAAQVNDASGRVLASFDRVLGAASGGPAGPSSSSSSSSGSSSVGGSFAANAAAFREGVALTREAVEGSTAAAAAAGNAARVGEHVALLRKLSASERTVAELGSQMAEMQAAHANEMAQRAAEVAAAEEALEELKRAQAAKEAAAAAAAAASAAAAVASAGSSAAAEAEAEAAELRSKLAAAEARGASSLAAARSEAASALAAAKLETAAAKAEGKRALEAERARAAAEAAELAAAADTARAALSAAEASHAEAVAALQGQLAAARDEVTALRAQLAAVQAKAAADAQTAASKLRDAERRAEAADARAVSAAETTAAYKAQFEVADARRAVLLEQVIDLKGNIRVFARVRPLLPGEEGGAAHAVAAPGATSGAAASASAGSKSSAAAGGAGKKGSSGATAPAPRAPLFAFPAAHSEATAVEVVEGAGTGVGGYGVGAPKRHAFELNRVFPPTASQADVFGEVEQLVQSALDGHTVTIVCYGQTGSGKSWTTFGATAGEGRGMVPRAVQSLFARLDDMQRMWGWSYSVSAECVEVYCDEARDLLAGVPSSSAAAAAASSSSSAAAGAKGKAAAAGGTAAAKKPAATAASGKAASSSSGAGAGAGAGAARPVLAVREDKTGAVTLPGLTTVPVPSAAAATPLIAAALAARATDATAMNASSSRSHCLFTLRISMEHSLTAQKRSGVLTLADLAGSERLDKSGSGGSEKLLKETQAINKSLSLLSTCLMAIKEARPHIPFRSTLLTRLLQNSLGGGKGCKTLLICTLSPAHASEHESLCTLRFAKGIAEAGSIGGGGSSSAGARSIAAGSVAGSLDEDGDDE